ncbi:MAG: DUF4097 domain-containing protein [Pseudomonadota bacterium]
MTPKHILLYLTLALLVPTAAFADRERVSESRDVASNGFVRILVVRGEIDIQGWDNARVTVDGLIDEQAEEFVFETRGDDTTIEVKLPRNLNSWCCQDGSELRIRVPRDSRVDVSVVSTDVTLDNVRGGTEIAGVSGDLRVSNLADRVEVTSVSGDIELASATGRIELKSVSGDLTVNDLAGDISLHSVSGNVVARNLGEELDIESVSGDVEVVDARFVEFNGHTVSGDADIRGSLLDGGSLDFDSVSGRIRVRFSGPLDARFDVETGSGSIRNGVSGDKPLKSKYARDETLRFVFGEGMGEVRLGSRSGNVILSRD